MKSIAALLLCVAVCTLLLTACGGTPQASSEPAGDPVTLQSAPLEELGYRLDLTPIAVVAGEEYPLLTTAPAEENGEHFSKVEINLSRAKAELGNVPFLYLYAFSAKHAPNDEAQINGEKRALRDLTDLLVYQDENIEVYSVYSLFVSDSPEEAVARLLTESDAPWKTEDFTPQLDAAKRCTEHLPSLILPGAPAAPQEPVFAETDPYNAAVNLIAYLHENLPRESYGGISLAQTTDSALQIWAVDRPTIEQVLSTYRKEQVPVTYRDASYSLAELDQLSEQLKAAPVMELVTALQYDEDSNKICLLTANDADRAAVEQYLTQEGYDVWASCRVAT